MKRIVITLVFFLIIFSLFSQKPPAKTSFGIPKGAVVATFFSDMDCYIKLNASTKVIPVVNNMMQTSVDKYIIKSGEPASLILKAGENKIEAFTLDNKNSLKKSVSAKANERPNIDLTFLGDNKFLDYIKEGNLLMVEGAVKKNAALINNTDESLMSSPLETAIVNSKVDIVKFLLDNGADFNTPEKIYPLHKVASFASNKIPKAGGKTDDIILVDLFLSKGCKINDLDDGGNTPLHCAVRANKAELVKYLVELGADVNAKNVFEDTPLKIAQDKGLVSVIDYLKTKNAVDK